MTISSSLITVINSPVAVYTSVNSTCNTVVYFCNTSSSSAVVVDVYVGPAVGGAPPPDGIIYKSLSINATDTYMMSTERLMLDNDDKLWVSASVADVLAVTVSYIEV
jgi:hypothetical protein